MPNINMTDMKGNVQRLKETLDVDTHVITGQDLQR